MESEYIFFDKQTEEDDQLQTSNVSLHKYSIENSLNSEDAVQIESENDHEQFSNSKLGSDTTEDATGRNSPGEEDSLLQYGNAVRVGVVEPKLRHSTFVNSTLFQVLKSEAVFSHMKTHSKFRCSRKPIRKEDIPGVLTLIKAPRQFVMKGEVWSQEISSTPNNCDDTLEDKLHQQLVKRKAREEGICPIRRALHDDCLDEIHRQIALESPERAILLVRCRREIQNTLAVFLNLCGSIQTYNLRQSMLKNSGYQDFHDKLKSAKDEKMQLTRSCEALEEEIRRSQATYEVDEAAFQKKKNTELEFLRAVHLRLQSQTSKFLNISKTTKSPAEVATASDALQTKESKGDSGNANKVAKP